MKTAMLSVWIGLVVAAGEVRAQDSVEAANLALITFDQDSSRVRGSDPYRGENAWHGTARLFFGAKALDEDDWEPVDAQSEFAILTDFGREDWGIRMALDLRFGVSDEEDFLGFDVVSSSWELNLGVRKVFDTKSIVKPFIGGGLAFGGATLDVEVDDDSDAGIGIWLDAGIDFSLGGPVSLGFELAYSTIPIDIADVDTDAGGFRFGITVGFSW
jgi:opacity protein-like surface antigen